MTISTSADDTQMSLTSADVTADTLAALRDLLPAAFTEGKLDVDCLQKILGEFGTSGPDRYNLSWAGRSEAFHAIQSLSTKTLVPIPSESVNFDTSQNLILEGDNLEILKLLQKSYHDKVKTIYIDPPYNTGSDFVYEDDFTSGKLAYDKNAGLADQEGNRLRLNTKDNGRFHSNWLNMMYPRLFLAKNLLHKDGLIFVSIDDNELHNLRFLMSSIFGEECFKNCAIFRRGVKNVQAQFDTVDALAVGHEYIIVYAKNIKTRMNKLEIALEESKGGAWNNHWRGTDRPTMRYEIFGIIPETGQWRWGKSRSLAAIVNYENFLEEIGNSNPSQEEIDALYLRKLEEEDVDIDLLRLSSSGKPEHYIPPSESKLGSDLWTDISPRGSTELKSLFGSKLFENPKPTTLIRRILQFTTDAVSNDIVLDFFAGSGSTAQAVLEANEEDGGNRKFILIQLPEATRKMKEDGSYKETPASRAGYNTIAEITKERTRRVIARLKTNSSTLSAKSKTASEAASISPLDLGFKVFKLRSSNFNIWNAEGTPKDEIGLAEQLELYVDNVKSDRTPDDILFELLLKAGLPLTTQIEKITEAQDFYAIAGGILLICLADPIQPETLTAMRMRKPERVICLDTAFHGNDQLKTNAMLEMKSHGIEFRTV